MLTACPETPNSGLPHSLIPLCLATLPLPAMTSALLQSGVSLLLAASPLPQVLPLRSVRSAPRHPHFAMSNTQTRWKLSTAHSGVTCAPLRLGVGPYAPFRSLNVSSKDLRYRLRLCALSHLNSRGMVIAAGRNIVWQPTAAQRPGCKRPARCVLRDRPCGSLVFGACRLETRFTLLRSRITRLSEYRTIALMRSTCPTPSASPHNRVGGSPPPFLLAR